MSFSTILLIVFSEITTHELLNRKNNVIFAMKLCLSEECNILILWVFEALSNPNCTTVKNPFIIIKPFLGERFYMPVTNTE